MKGLALLILATALWVPAALAGGFPGVARAPHARSFVAASTGGVRVAVTATVRAQRALSRRAWKEARFVASIFGDDLRDFWTFLTERLTLSPRLAENPFFEAHKEAVIAADRADEAWDLSWAIPEELREPDAWRAAVANLAPASLRGAHATPERGVTFTGWPPIAN